MSSPLINNCYGTVSFPDSHVEWESGNKTRSTAAHLKLWVLCLVRFLVEDTLKTFGSISQNSSNSSSDMPCAKRKEEKLSPVVLHTSQLLQCQWATSQDLVPLPLLQSWSYWAWRWCILCKKGREPKPFSRVSLLPHARTHTHAHVHCTVTLVDIRVVWGTGWYV